MVEDPLKFKTLENATLWSRKVQCAVCGLRGTRSPAEAESDPLAAQCVVRSVWFAVCGLPCEFAVPAWYAVFAFLWYIVWYTTPGSQ